MDNPSSQMILSRSTSLVSQLSSFSFLFYSFCSTGRGVAVASTPFPRNPSASIYEIKDEESKIEEDSDDEVVPVLMAPSKQKQGRRVSRP